MPLSTYAELRAAIAAWLKRNDAGREFSLVDRAPELIALAEAEFNRVLRVRAMVARGVITVDGEYEPLPADYAGMRALTLTTGGATRVEELSDQELELRAVAYAAAGRPAHFAVVGETLRLHPAPDVAYAARYTWYRRIPALSDSNPGNWLLTRHPDAYLYGALAQAAPYLRDDARTALWQALYGRALAAIQRADRAERRGTPLRSEVAQALGERAA